MITSSINAFGLNIFGSSTTFNASPYPIFFINLFKYGLDTASNIVFSFNRQPYTASVVCNGFKQVVTFILSVFSTVSLSVTYTPASDFSNSGLPLGNLSSTTKYSGASAFTKAPV